MYSPKGKSKGDDICFAHMNHGGSCSVLGSGALVKMGSGTSWEWSLILTKDTAPLEVHYFGVVSGVVLKRLAYSLQLEPIPHIQELALL